METYVFSTGTSAGVALQVLRDKRKLPSRQKKNKNKTSKASKACGRIYKAPPRRAGRKGSTRAKHAPPLQAGNGTERTGTLRREKKTNPASSPLGSELSDPCVMRSLSSLVSTSLTAIGGRSMLPGAPVPACTHMCTSGDADTVTTAGIPRGRSVVRAQQEGQAGCERS